MVSSLSGWKSLRLTIIAKLPLPHDVGLREHCHGQLGDFASVSTLTATEFALSLLTTYLRLFTFVLIDGGTALLFWGFIVVALGMLMVYASVAEMASM